MRRGSSLRVAVPRQVSTFCTAQNHIMVQRVSPAYTATQHHSSQQTSLGASTRPRHLRNKPAQPVVAAVRRVVVPPRDMSPGAGVGSLNLVTTDLTIPVVGHMKLRNFVALLRALLTV